MFITTRAPPVSGDDRSRVIGSDRTVFRPPVFSKKRRVNLRQLIAAAAMTACAWQSADAAEDTSATPPQQDATPARNAGTLPSIAVVGDTQHLPQSFDQRYATTRVLTRADLDRLAPSDPSITQALATGITSSRR